MIEGFKTRKEMARESQEKAYPLTLILTQLPFFCLVIHCMLSQYTHAFFAGSLTHTHTTLTSPAAEPPRQQAGRGGEGRGGEEGEKQGGGKKKKSRQLTFQTCKERGWGLMC